MMYYITVEHCGMRRLVGSQENFATAMTYADAIGEFFSDEGVTRPQVVRVHVEDADLTRVVVREWYNGYVKHIYSYGV